MTNSLRDHIVCERRELADLLSTLTAEQWQTPSLMPTWTVREVAAHLVVGIEMRLMSLVWALVTTRSMDGAADKLTFAMARRPTSELIATLRDKAERIFLPPGCGPDLALMELIVHGLDLRRPLGVGREVPEERVRPVLNFLATTPLRGLVKPSWRQGLRFAATSLAWSHGHGPTVRGHADDLMLALTGRPTAVERLEGDGAPLLAERLGFDGLQRTPSGGAP